MRAAPGYIQFWNGELDVKAGETFRASCGTLMLVVYRDKDLYVIRPVSWLRRLLRR